MTNNPPHRTLRIALSAVATLFLMGGASAHAGEMLELSSGRVEAEYHAGDAGLARRSAAAVEFACERIAADLGVRFEGPVRVSVVRGQEEFDRACAREMPAWALAAALPGRGRIVVNAVGVTPATGNDLNLTIFHETVHLALSTLERGRAESLPLWFHEGVATWLSGQSHVRVDRSAFALAANQGALIPLDRLTRAFPQGREAASLAYQQSAAFVAHLAETRSPESLRWILDRYREGESFEAAFRTALGMSRSEAETRWRESYRRRFPWLRTLWQITSLMGVMAIATVLTYVIVRRRARRQHRAWEREEAWTAVLDEEAGEAPEPDEDDGWG